MLQEYYYEIIASIAALTLIVIYFLTRKFKQQEEDFAQYTPTKKSTSEIKTLHTIKHNDVDDFEPEPYALKEDEGSFGSIDENPFEETIQETVPQTKKYKKMEVPAHGKISKEDFKEFSGVKLLLAEDNIINQKVINGLFQGSGIEVTIADDGQIALDILSKNSDFDIILMDVHMPRLDGFDTTRAIRNNPNYDHIVIVALSGDIAVDDVRKMTEAGMQEHLQKPLKMDAFYDILYGYTKSNSISKQVNSETFIINTKELNGEKGLEICGGDESFYKDILHEFRLSYTNTSHKLLELLQKKEVRLADALLLDFMGITANIGAENIRNIALELKLAIKDLEEKSYVTILDDFEVHLERLLKDIESYLK